MQTPATEKMSPLARMVRSDVFPGLLLVACALLAIAMANSPWADAWNELWHVELSLGFGDRVLAKSLSHWISDGLMVLFFFFVGLEIKYEVVDGHLQSFRQAALPVAAAIGGMAAPAALYMVAMLANGTPEFHAGWGIPMATDIAFALGVLALLGRRTPVTLKVFLASLAVADDLGAVLVIALFYTAEISWYYLGFGALVLVLSFVSNRLGVRRTWPYVVYGLVLWLTFLESGVHATIAGVALAMTIPARRRLDEYEFSERGRGLLAEFDRIADPDPQTHPEQILLVRQLQQHAIDVQAPLQRMAYGLQPLVAHFIVPVFALANAGVDVSHGLAESASHPAAQGVFLGLLVGKPVGILAATWLAARLLRAELPSGVTWRHVHGAAWIAGIGFTMSLFIDRLAFADQLVAHEASKIAVLAASFAAGAIGYVVLLRAPRPDPAPESISEENG